MLRRMLEDARVRWKVDFLIGNFYDDKDVSNSFASRVKAQVSDLGRTKSFTLRWVFSTNSVGDLSKTQTPSNLPHE